VNLGIGNPAPETASSSRTYHNLIDQRETVRACTASAVAKTPRPAQPPVSARTLAASSARTKVAADGLGDLCSFGGGFT
jgi:hypothetical protein